MGAWAPMDGPGMCCAQLDDFDWVVPHYEPNMLLSGRAGRDMEVEITDIGWDICVLPDVLPVLFDETAAVPLPLPVVVETGPQVDCEMDILLSGWDVEVEFTDIGRDIRILPDVFPVMFDKAAAVPLSSPVVVDTGPQVDVRRKTTPTVVPLVDGSDRPAGLVNSKSDCCVTNERVLVPEMSPVVSARGAAVPTFLPTMSEMFSSAALAGGGSLLRQRGRDSHSASVCPAGSWE